MINSGVTTKNKHLTAVGTAIILGNQQCLNLLPASRTPHSALRSASVPAFFAENTDRSFIGSATLTQPRCGDFSISNAPIFAVFISTRPAGSLAFSCLMSTVNTKPRRLPSDSERPRFSFICPRTAFPTLKPSLLRSTAATRTHPTFSPSLSRFERTLTFSYRSPPLLFFRCKQHSRRS